MLSFNRRAGETFFKLAFGTAQGLVCLGFISRESRRTNTRELEEKWFNYPGELERACDLIEERFEDHDVYYCPQLFARRQRTKENVSETPSIWADLDLCPPSELLLEPTTIIRTSPGRTQALWRCYDASPEQAEELSKRIHYFHADKGADRSGWDLTQLLRVPGTHNFKYDDDTAELHIFTEAANRNMYRLNDFAAYPDTGRRDGEGIEKPEDDDIPVIENPMEFLTARRRLLNSQVYSLFNDEPDQDEFREGWSGALWKLIMFLFEGGLSREEVFAICDKAACNKYRRDQRDPKHLWKDVVRGFNEHQKHLNTVIIPEYHQTELMTDDELEAVTGRETFVERYIKWAKELGDAAVQYHTAGAFIVLSALLSGKVSLPTSFGEVVPNLWFMILADTTLTRKSTAMDIAIDLLVEVDPDAIMATDGSLEGLMQGLSMRPGRPSVFLRDEFTGLLESMTKKDYMAGMPEMLTKLYDGKYAKRLLRKEPVEIRDPRLILFAGGIKSRTQQLLTLEHISSGFIPRFVFITAESDVSKVRPTGPPVLKDLSGRRALLGEMVDMYDWYNQAPIKQGGGIKLRQAERKWSCTLTEDAWLRFNQFETQMLEAAIASDRPDILTPTYARLSVSTLKAAILIAASEARTDDDAVTIDVEHILLAINYAREWREYAIDIINGVGKSAQESQVERTMKLIRERPGISRSAIMQRFHMTANEANSLFATLEQRGLVYANRMGKGTVYRASGSNDPEELE